MVQTVLTRVGANNINNGCTFAMIFRQKAYDIRGKRGYHYTMKCSQSTTLTLSMAQIRAVFPSSALQFQFGTAPSARARSISGMLPASADLHNIVLTQGFGVSSVIDTDTSVSSSRSLIALWVSSSARPKIDQQKLSHFLSFNTHPCIKI